jgi:hypothetical protein
MAIMTKEEWKNATRRAGHFRSKELDAVDKALDRYRFSAKAKDDLEALDTTFKAWTSIKGNDGLNSIRNHINAVQRLRDEIDSELLKFAPSVVFQPLRIQAVDKSKVLVAGRTFKSQTTTTRTMTDDDLVTDFTDKVKLLWTQRSWDSKSPQQRGEAVLNAVQDVHTACNIPNVTPVIKNLKAGYAGFFQSWTWSIELSAKLFEFPFNLSNRRKLADLAETAYHESRHCEQWFHMARYYALGRQAADVAQWIEIPQRIADIAWQRRMTSDDKMIDLTTDWYESVFGTEDRAITLTALGLRRQSTTVEMENYHDRIHDIYTGDLAEEVDAWGIQLLVRAKF